MYDAAGYLDQLQKLLPPGQAWPRRPDAMLTQLLAGLAEEFARLDARADTLIEEADPRTALEMLPDWERLVGLPDPCTGTIAATVPERRAAIVGKLTARGGQSIPYLTQLGRRAGLRDRDRRVSPVARGGLPGRRLLPGITDWAFAFRVNVLPPGAAPGAADPLGQTTALADLTVNIVYARAGQARAGDRVVSFGSTAIECVIRRVQPAHTVSVFAYPPADAPVFSFDFTSV